MPQAVAGPEIERLIQLLARMPGLGPRSARRAALQLIKKRDTLLAPLADAMRVAAERIVVCTGCGNVDTSRPLHDLQGRRARSRRPWWWSRTCRTSGRSNARAR